MLQFFFLMFLSVADKVATVEAFNSMTVEKKFFPTVEEAFKIRERQQDLNKEWYVEFFLDGKRKRIRGNINQFHSVIGRREAAKVLRLELMEKYEHQIINDLLTHKELILLKLKEKRDERKWRKKTYEGNQSKVRTFFEYIGKDNFQKKDVVRFFKHLAKQRHQSTYNGYWIKLNMIFGFIGKSHLWKALKKDLLSTLQKNTSNGIKLIS